MFHYYAVKWWLNICLGYKKDFMKLYKKTIALFMALFAGTVFWLSAQTKKSEDRKLVTEQIEERYKKSSKRFTDSWSSNTYREFLQKLIKRQKTTHPFYVQQNAFDFLKSCETQKRLYQTHILDNTDTWDDLNLFCGNPQSKEIFLGSLVDRTVTPWGKCILYHALVNPSDDLTLLKKRQLCIKHLVSDSQLFYQIDELFKTIKKETLNLFLSFFMYDNFENDVKHGHLFDTPIEKLSRILNNNALALEIKNLKGEESSLWQLFSSCMVPIALGLYAYKKFINELSPAADRTRTYFGGGMPGGFLPAFLHIGNFEKPLLITTLGALATVTTVFGIKNTYDHISAKVLLWQCLQEKLIAVKTFFKLFHKVHVLSIAHPAIAQAIPTLKNIKTVFDKKKNPEIAELNELLMSSTFDEPSFFSSRGKILKAFQLMHEHKKQLEPALQALADLDFHFSIAKLYKEFENKNARYCFAEFKDSTTPSINVQNAWQPFITPENVVLNTICLGENNKRGVIISGPNEGGKSATLRMVTLNAILAQTMTIAPAQVCSLTPFSKIRTYFDIQDDIASGHSLFRAAAIRIGTILKTVQELPANKFALIATDEIGRETSPVEARAMAYSTMKHLGEFENTICLAATHFPLVTQLEKDTENFTNYKVSVDRIINRDGSTTIKHHYKLEKGISDQHVALDVLQHEGISNEITNLAQQIINSK